MKKNRDVMKMLNDIEQKPQMNADERRYAHVMGFADFPTCRGLFVTDSGRTAYRKGRKERKEKQQESLCPLCAPWLNISSDPAHERAPPQPALYPRLSGAGG